MTLKKFLTHLENIMLDDNEVNQADVIEGVLMVELVDGSRFQLEVTEI